MLTPLTNSVVVGLVDEAAVLATGTTIGVDIGLDIALEPSLLAVDFVDVSLVTAAAGEVWIPNVDRVPEMIPVSEGYLEIEDRKELVRVLVVLSLVWACKVEEDGV